MAITKVTTDGIDMKDNTGALTWVKGTTAQQPSGALGEIREDTTAKRAVVYTDQTGTAEWRYLKEISTEITVSYLVIGGGGGGAGSFGGGGNGTGGGGAGGYRNSYASENSGGNSSTETPLTLSINTPYQIEVGIGGSAGTASTVGTTASNGGQGGQSRFDSIISAGGGYGSAVTTSNPGGDG